MPNNTLTELYNGNLGFDLEHPIESVVYYETNDIQKIYWVDGVHVLRFMNFMASAEERSTWQADGSSFDSNMAVDFGVYGHITKDNGGNTRANGVVQYFLTYYNKHGQESGYVWASDLVYLSPPNVGGSADGTNNNSVSIYLSRLDTNFTHFRLYSVFRSSLNGTTTTYLVADQKIPEMISNGYGYYNKVTIVDDGAHLTVQDSSKLLYLGSKAVIASTLTHKDQTLFLGDLKSVGRSDYSDLETILKTYMFDLEGAASFVEGSTYKSLAVEFVYSTPSGTNQYYAEDIPYVKNAGNYSYENQLQYTSSSITTFKAGEKYRFALKFQMQDGTETDAFWIGDVENTLYPIIDISSNTIVRAVAKCTLPGAVVTFLQENGFKTAKLMVAEATDADRSVKAQGIVNPTVFNVWDRYNNQIYAMPSWISRPRGSNHSKLHFEAIRRSDSPFGEIQCNYWNDPDLTTYPHSNPARPYFQYTFTTSDTNLKYADKFDGMSDFQYIMIVYNIAYGDGVIDKSYDVVYFIYTADELTGAQETTLKNYPVGSILESDWKQDDEEIFVSYYTDTSGFTIKRTIGIVSASDISVHPSKLKDRAYAKLKSSLLDKGYGAFLPLKTTFDSWYNTALTNNNSYYNYFYSESERFSSLSAALAAGSNSASRWSDSGEIAPNQSSGNYMPAYYKQHLMFIDENVVTLDSPELAYNSFQIQSASQETSTYTGGYKFRIVGVAKMSSVMSDYTVDATQGKLSGNNLDTISRTSTSDLSGLLAWPMWKDYVVREQSEEEATDGNPEYEWGSSIVHYWIYMWHNVSSIVEFSAADDTESYSNLNTKIFANLRFAYTTIYSTTALNVATDSISTVSELSNNYTYIKVGSESKYYSGTVNTSLSVPGTFKYPIFCSRSSSSADSPAQTVFSSSPVSLSYRTLSHAVISLKTTESGRNYTQNLLPALFSDEASSIPGPVVSTTAYTRALLPWFEINEPNPATSSYAFQVYNVSNLQWSFARNDSRADTITNSNDEYLFIGEIYRTFSSSYDTRYGGISSSAVKSNRFISASEAYPIDMMYADNNDYIIGNDGDTYFQRWDAMRAKPYSTGAANNVIDITSVMLETHINLDGRTDKMRGVSELASIDVESFGQINPVYSQKNSFIVGRDLDEDYNTDAYRTAITWTLPKSDMADVDEWTHITLANTLKLDGDKGKCNALRRFQNAIIAFQDRGISEILFNSRTQLSTEGGVPVEIANSGKVDGKRYITNKYGCTNKWSIVEGKKALYFVDNINKIFCAFNGNSVDNLSSRFGFDVWFRSVNNIDPWTPKYFNNIVSFYDRIHDDVYLVRNTADDYPCLVFNEKLEKFTSFFEYGSVPMLTNVCDRFISYYGNRLWYQNEGTFCNFFSTQYDYWVTYRVAPEPQLDKIWTNVDCRVDFYDAIDYNVMVPDENQFIDGGEAGSFSGIYLKDEIFSSMEVWNEYQQTSVTSTAVKNPVKKFRIWRYQIPRAIKTVSNKFGFDRIRNPWIFIKFKKNVTGDKVEHLMQLHDVEVKYFE